jgi:hypothetical protein
MTRLLEKAFSQASHLSEKEQDSLAKRLLAELNSERKWDELFAESKDELAELAKETLAIHRSKKTNPLDINKL